MSATILDRIGLQCSGVGLPLCRCLRCRAEMTIHSISQYLEGLELDRAKDESDVLIVVTGNDEGPFLRELSWALLKCKVPAQYEALRREIGTVEPGHVAFFIQLDEVTFSGTMAINREQERQHG